MRMLLSKSSGLVATLFMLAGGSLHAQSQAVFAYTSSPGAGTTALVTDQGTFNFLDRGWVNGIGFHSATNMNYITGECGPDACFGPGGLAGTSRSFFLFDLSNLGTSITSATLRLYNPINPPDFGNGYISSDPTEMFLLSFLDPTWYDDVQADQVGNLSLYAALTGGTAMGSRVFSAADNGFNIDITLNADAIAAINRMQGQLWGVAGCLDGFGCGETTESTVPEPATMTLLATGLAGMAAARRRKRA